MADEAYWVCFVTDSLPADIGAEIVTCAEKVGFDLVEEADEEIILRLDEETTVSISLNTGGSWDWNEPRLILSFWTKPFQQRSVDEESTARPEKTRNRTEKILDLVVELTKLIGPEYVWSMLNAGTRPDAGLRPMAPPIADNLSHLSWVTVFSQRITADLGGRDRLQETPAWRVEPIDESHTMVVTTDNPVDPTFEPEDDSAEFLFADTDTESTHQS